MRTLCLFMLVLCWIPESDGAALSDNVLAGIVSQFRQVSGGRQFAFLMILTPEQCTGTNINQNVEFIPSNSGEPVITGNPNDFLKNPLVNYIAVYPNTGSARCPESKLLEVTQEDWEHGRHDNVYQRLWMTINNRPSDNQLQVGCIIIYTTDTAPPIRSCFKNLKNCDFICSLRQYFFRNTWKSTGIKKYFVFSQVYKEDNNLIQAVQNKLATFKHFGFYIKRCDVTDNQMQCRDCYHLGHCIQ